VHSLQLVLAASCSSPLKTVCAHLLSFSSERRIWFDVKWVSHLGVETFRPTRDDGYRYRRHEKRPIRGQLSSHGRPPGWGPRARNG
jgi:hypothetical protein